MSDTEGQAQVLVVYHYYESLTMCEEDEEVQVIRSNLLTFLRCLCSSIRTLVPAFTTPYAIACQDQIWCKVLPHRLICVQDQPLARVMPSSQLTIQLCLSLCHIVSGLSELAKPLCIICLFAVGQMANCLMLWYPNVSVKHWHIQLVAILRHVQMR